MAQAISMRRRSGPLTRLEALLRPSAGPRRLLLYGLVAAVLCSALSVAVAPDPWPTQEGRFLALQGAAVARMQGQPVLTEIVIKGDSETPAGALTASNASDDQGLYLFGAIAGDLLGTTDPSTIFAVLRALLFAITTFALPWAIWRLTGSLTVAVAAPFAVTIGVLGIQVYDLYWIVPWAVIGLLPIVLAAGSERRRSMFWILAAACLLAGLATSIRNHAGLPVVAAALIVLLWSPWRWPGRALVAVALCVAYLAIPAGVLGIARDARDDRLGSASPATIGNTHLFWHPMYLGLGYLPNRHGIVWSDRFGEQRALQEDPAADYPTARYEGVMRDLYFDLLEDDPGLVASVTAKKLVVAVAWAAPGLMLLALALPAFLALHPRRRDFLRWVLLLLPAIGLGLVQPLVGIPAHLYTAGWIASVGLLVLLLAGVLAATAEASPRALVRSAASAIFSSRHARTIQIVTVAGVLAVAGLWFSAVQFRAQAADWVAERDPIQGQAP